MSARTLFFVMLAANVVLFGREALLARRGTQEEHMAASVVTVRGATLVERTQVWDSAQCLRIHERYSNGVEVSEPVTDSRTGAYVCRDARNYSLAPKP